MTDLDTRPESRAGEKSVLLADDDQDLREVLAEIVTLAGWNVWQACDGEEALRCTSNLHPDVLVLDHRMPRLNGIEVVQSLREAGNQVPVVFISAANDVEHLALSVGINCHLRKPFGVDELIVLIERALKAGS